MTAEPRLRSSTPAPACPRRRCASARDHRPLPAGRASALLPLLHLVQCARRGTSRRTASSSAPSMLGLTTAEVGAVATFYTMYKRRPTGDYLVSVCTNTLCACWAATRSSSGSRSTSASATTRPPPTARSPSSTLECLAACDYAPVVTVNYEFFDNVTPRVGARSWSTTCARARRSAPTRGARLCTLAGGRARAGRLRRRPRRRGPGRGPARWSASASPASAAAPEGRTAGTTSGTPGATPREQADTGRASRRPRSRSPRRTVGGKGDELDR